MVDFTELPWKSALGEKSQTLIEPAMEVETNSAKALRKIRSTKIKRRVCPSQSLLCSLSSVNRRQRFWTNQVKRRRRMCLYGGYRRSISRPHCQLSKPCSEGTSPVPVRVDANIVVLLQKKRKQLKRDGLYQFVLWKEALKAERNRLMESRSLHT
ncbi:hypothetical protein J437_LFUL013410 [Ladona fulva]|uniref:Uncharacterized protein n=1 Tax=Ladona fulva TaxID=123851 RepID=A0A8K0KE04_LADFU|nr:hypothetical protein J437_LFUL013410 [Ladona fulva]